MRGPLKGATIALPEGDYSIGRHGTNHLQLEDHGVSRQHCVFTRTGDSCELKDLESRNGTFVNGKPVTVQQLSSGDEIRIGGSLLVYLTGTQEVASNADTNTRHLRAEDSLYSASSDQKDISPSYRAVNDLRTLLRVSSMLHSFRGLHDMQGLPAAEVLRGHLSSLLLEMIPAERAGVFIPGQPVDGWAPDAEVFQRICRDQIAVWVEDADGAGLAQLGAPVMVRGELAAVIYLESADPTRRVDEGHLQLVTAVAEMASGAWENATILGWLQQENERLKTELKLEHDMLGPSAKMRELQRQIAKVAPSNSTVLILGESGTGKELIARATHRNSLRASGPFVAINCAALADTLLESELFGHEKGAFTGAVAQKKGKLELAEGGTVFLDEIGELAPPLQAKLLRVLQQREFERVGGTRTWKLNVRVIAATNRDLRAEVRRGAFREDLYHRLNVVALYVPALRERGEDIPALAAHFLERASARCRRRVTQIAPEALAYLRAYSWPGNVRELENAIERAVVLGDGETLLAEDLPETVLDAPAAPAAAPGALQNSVTDTKRQLILRAWEESGGDYKVAAQKLKIHPNSLLRLVRTLGLRETLR